MRRNIGKVAEDLACEYLKDNNLCYVTSNYYCRLGEIDLIMKDGDVMVFIEVRYRCNSDYGDPLVTVTKSKQQKRVKTASHYLQKNNLLNRVSCRFDVITITEEVMKINWIKNAFWQKW